MSTHTKKHYRWWKIYHTVLASPLPMLLCTLLRRSLTSTLSQFLRFPTHLKLTSLLGHSIPSSALIHKWQLMERFVHHTHYISDDSLWQVSILRLLSSTQKNINGCWWKLCLSHCLFCWWLSQPHPYLGYSTFSFISCNILHFSPRAFLSPFSWSLNPPNLTSRLATLYSSQRRIKRKWKLMEGLSIAPVVVLAMAISLWPVSVLRQRRKM